MYCRGCPSWGDATSSRKPTKHATNTNKGNMGESLFSVCNTMTDYRKRVGPEKLEATLVLRCSYDLRRGPIGQSLIQEIMNDEKAARTAAASCHNNHGDNVDPPNSLRVPRSFYEIPMSTYRR